LRVRRSEFESVLDLPENLVRIETYCSLNKQSNLNPLR
jgi:hypothetical protein